MIFIAILANHTTLAYNTDKSKVYFLRNEMTIFCSLVKITTTNTHKYLKKKIEKKISVILCKFGYIYRFIHPGNNLKFSAQRMYPHTLIY